MIEEIKTMAPSAMESEPTAYLNRDRRADSTVKFGKVDYVINYDKNGPPHISH